MRKQLPNQTHHSELYIISVDSIALKVAEFHFETKLQRLFGFNLSFLIFFHPNYHPNKASLIHKIESAVNYLLQIRKRLFVTKVKHKYYCNHVLKKFLVEI